MLNWLGVGLGLGLRAHLNDRREREISKHFTEESHYHCVILVQHFALEPVHLVHVPGKPSDRECTSTHKRVIDIGATDCIYTYTRYITCIESGRSVSDITRQRRTCACACNCYGVLINRLTVTLILTLTYSLMRECHITHCSTNSTPSTHS